MNKRDGVKCSDCRYYPDNCGCWVKNRRDKGGNAVPLPDPDRVHGCMDFKEKKGDEDNG